MTYRTVANKTNFNEGMIMFGHPNSRRLVLEDKLPIPNPNYPIDNELLYCLKHLGDCQREPMALPKRTGHDSGESPIRRSPYPPRTGCTGHLHT